MLILFIKYVMASDMGIGSRIKIMHKILDYSSSYIVLIKHDM